MQWLQIYGVVKMKFVYSNNICKHKINNVNKYLQDYLVDYTYVIRSVILL